MSPADGPRRPGHGGAGEAAAVPRETPPPPAVALGVFGSHLALAVRYAGLLAGPGVERGLLGPREVPRLWERHLLNCAVVAPELPAGATVVDVGSGAGLPGLVLALARPDVRVVLCEPLLRRTRFLAESVEALGLGNVTVVRARAEELTTGVPADVLTARAVAPLDRLLPWTLPLVRPGGRVLALKGAGAEAELAAVAAELPRWGAVSWRLLELGTEILDLPTRVVDIRVGPSVRQAGSSTRRRHGRGHRRGDRRPNGRDRT